MKQQFCDHYGRISPESKTCLIRNIYDVLTNNQLASRTTAEAEVDERVREVLLAEDAEIILDLREFNSNAADRFAVFWGKCNQF